MQGDAEFRSKPEDLAQWHVRNDLNEMVPFSNFAQVDWSGGPEVVNRFMGYTSLQMRIWSKVPVLVKRCKTLKIWWQNRMALTWSGAVYPLRKNNQ